MCIYIYHIDIDYVYIYIIDIHISASLRMAGKKSNTILGWSGERGTVRSPSVKRWLSVWKTMGKLWENGDSMGIQWGL